MARGTIVDPWTLGKAASTNQIRAGDTVYLRGGIYEGDRITFRGGGENRRITWKPYLNERPIITHADGEPPSINIGDHAYVSGIWFGGSRPAETGRTMQMGANAIVEDCTIFNYINGIQNGSDAHGNIFRRNRFVRCGYPSFWHALYVANLNSSLPEHGVLTEECIFAASKGGYPIHYYHEPSYGLARYNFIAGNSSNGMALQGDIEGPSAHHNIIWDIANAPLYYSNFIAYCDSNVWHGLQGPPNPGALSESKTFDNNYFTNAAHTAGTNPVTWNTTTDIEGNLGDTVANIDAAIAALDTAFQQTVAQIQADATIETHFATLKAVIDTWKANTR